MEIQPAAIQPRAFELPPFDVRLDSMDQWRQRANNAFQKYSRQVARDLSKSLEKLERRGLLVDLKRFRNRGSTTQAMRMRWAALHYCLEWSYPEIRKSKEHNPHRRSRHAISTAVTRLLSSLQLPLK
jgi:hypothetical protein